MEKTHWKQNFDYRYTGAYELAPGEERILTIKAVGREEVKDESGKNQWCMVANFQESSKPMILNKTNCKTLEKLYGPYQEDWIGKRIVIASAKVKAFGEMLDALRIKKTVPSPKQKVDYTKAFEVLSECKTIEELKNVYSQLTAEEKAATMKIKDQMKEKLTNVGK
jgi:hypothetical protein